MLTISPMAENPDNRVIAADYNRFAVYALRPHKARGFSARMVRDARILGLPVDGPATT
ncbi:MAG: hypothetical protein ABF990_05010 [Acetobacter sp.]|uniref:hypothetical protein n=2 Tax=Acetobacter sp. TaxID=440 RepID=UPI0039ED3A7B